VSGSRRTCCCSRSSTPPCFPSVRSPRPPLQSPPLLAVAASADSCFGCFIAWFDGAVRIGLRHNPVVRDRLFYGVLAGAFAHGAYLMYVLLPHLTPCFY
jgi:hypothetical protein